jgi:hypothetical protein
MKRAVVAGVVVLAAIAAALTQPARPDADMRAAANTLIAAVDDAQRAKLVWDFDSEERFNWHFIPRERQGLPLKEMTDDQRELAFTLLRTGLSASGFTKAEAIRGLEEVLFAMTGRAIRDNELYFFTIFGDPSDDTWAWRYEGHHLAQNWTIAADRAIATTPAFFGTNPATVADGPKQGLRALPAEQDLAFAVLDSLSPAQRQTAIVSDTAPRDIITGAERRAAIIDNTGLAASAMTDEQQGLLMTLIQEHASAQVPALAAARLARVRAVDLDDLRFAWMGSTEPGPDRGHYYRIQGSTFLIEYDNTQNGANHQHVVWRDFDGDFGADVLDAHYAGAPHHDEAPIPRPDGPKTRR